MKEQITYDTFDKVDIRVGTVISVQKNEKARKPSLVVKVDFGDEIGIKQSSAQITHYYNEENLKGKQVIGVCNFPEKNIAGVVSQVLILGSIDKEGKVILVHPSQKSENGLPIAYKMHPEILSITLFGIVAAFTPGPNNFIAFYSGFNFGIKRTIPLIIGVTLGFPFLLLCVALGLINIFKLYPLIQEILKYLGTLFLIYLAYKISFSKSTKVENKDKNPVKFINTFVFQFLNPKGVIASIIVVSTYLDPGENFVNFTTQIIILALIVSVTSITLWTFMGKFIRKFATNQKYINYFNYVMSLLLLISIITFYL